MIDAMEMPGDHFCLACYTGDYPLPPPENFGKFCMEDNPL
jgi:amidophosphoribosyltransferase